MGKSAELMALAKKEMQEERDREIIERIKEVLADIEEHERIITARQLLLENLLAKADRNEIEEEG